MTAGDGGGLLVVLLLIYIVPSAVAVMRGDKHIAGIVILNLFLGWTVVGWVGALIWAVCDTTIELKRR